MVSTRRSKRAADAVSDDDSADSNKRQQTDQPITAPTESDSVIEHHRYPPEQESDLIITLYDQSATRHDFHVHRKTLSSSKYVTLLIDKQDIKQNMRVSLPNTFTWIVAELKQWLDMCYSRYDKMLDALAHAPSARAFAELLYHTGATTTITDDQDASRAETEWTYTGHRDDGSAEITKDDNGMTVIAGGFVLRPSEMAFAELTDEMSVMTQLEISHYFQCEHLTDLLVGILTQFTRCIDFGLVKHIAVAAEKLQIAKLRKASIEALANLIPTDLDSFHQLTDLSAAFLAELFCYTQTQFAVQPADSSRWTIKHYRYPIERKSDLIITLHEADVRHTFNVHQQTLSLTSKYFASLIDNKDNEEQMTVALPSSFTWNAAQLKQWLDIVYGQHSKMLDALAQAHSAKEFVELIFRKGYVTAVQGDKDANNVAGQWTVTGHRASGHTDVINTVDQRQMTIVPSSCSLTPAQTDFANVTESQDFLVMFAISQYFDSKHITDLLTSILMQYTKCPPSHALLSLIAAAADKFPAERLRSACMQQLLRVDKWEPNHRQQVARLPRKFLADLVATSAAKTQTAEAKAPSLLTTTQT